MPATSYRSVAPVESALAAESHSMIYARVHPALAALQGLPRYSRALERVGL